MIEQQLRDGLQAALTREPPLGFDPDQVVDGAKRSTHRRRTILATAGAVLVIAVGTATAVGVWAGGRDLAPLMPGVSRTVPLQEASQRLGESITTVLPDVTPGAGEFSVVANEFDEYRAVSGVVYFEGNDGRSAVMFHVGEHVRGNACSFTADVPDSRFRTILRDGVCLTLGTSNHPEVIKEDPCDCDREWTLVTDAAMQQLITDERLVLPDPRKLRRDREQIEAGQEQLKEQAERQQELQRELEEMERKKAKPGGR